MFPALEQLEAESWTLLRWTICEFQLPMGTLPPSLDGASAVMGGAPGGQLE